jgi:hypothetical protein
MKQRTVEELAGTNACSQPSCHASRLKGLLTPALQAPSTRGTGSCMILPVALRERPPWRASFAALYRALSAGAAGRQGRKFLPRQLTEAGTVAISSKRPGFARHLMHWGRRWIGLDLPRLFLLERAPLGGRD